jgi:hypothetical protein
MGKRSQRKTSRGNEGKVLTPYGVALYMVDKLFKDSRPTPSSRVMDAGFGPGVFIDAIIDWCSNKGLEVPEIIGVEIGGKLVFITPEK